MSVRKSLGILILAIGLAAVGACFGPAGNSGAGSDHPVAQRIRSKVEAVKTGIHKQKRSGEDVSGLMDILMQARERFDAGDPIGGEEYLDKILAKLGDSSFASVGSVPAGRSTSIYAEPRRVTLHGYDGHVMEPFISRDGRYMFWNNSNAPGVDTNLHYATYIDDYSFDYKGQLPGSHSSEKDAVASMDRDGNFYMITTRGYFDNFRTIYRARFNNERLSDVEPVMGNIARGRKPFLNMDAEISADGNTLYFTDNEFSEGAGAGYPKTSNLKVARRSGSSFQVVSNSDEIMANVNSDALEYAPATTEDELTLFFTRANLEQLMSLRGGAENAIFMATRSRTSEPFGEPERIDSIRGFVEAPTVAPDGRSFYFHKTDSGKFTLYRVERVGAP